MTTIIKITRFLALAALLFLDVGMLLEFIKNIIVLRQILLPYLAGVVFASFAVAYFWFRKNQDIWYDIGGALFYMPLVIRWFAAVKEHGVEQYTYDGMLLSIVLPHLAAVIWREHKAIGGKR